MQNININVIFGGSFNPPTIAHYEIAKILKGLPGVSNLIILPVGMKYQKDSLINDDKRLDMVKLLAKRVNALVSDLELHNDKYYGTLHTLDELSKSFDDIYFVMGADNLLHLDKWINYETLLDKYNFIVFTRDDIDCEKVIDEKFQKYKDHFLLYPLHIDVSSTMVRDNIEENKELLLDEIYEYIKEKGLYEVK